MSPPAQLTRMWTSPRSASILRFISATASWSPMLPVTDVTFVAMPLQALDHLAEIGELAVLGRRCFVQVVDRDIGAEFREALGHDAAEAAARAGDEGDLSVEFLVVIRSSPLSSNQVAHVRGAAPDHVELVGDQRAVVVALPGGAVVGIVGQPVALRGRAGRRRARAPSSAHSRATSRAQKADMPRLECARFEHGGHAIVVLGENREQLRERHRAIADGAADQPVAFVVNCTR